MRGHRHWLPFLMMPLVFASCLQSCDNSINEKPIISDIRITQLIAPRVTLNSINRGSLSRVVTEVTLLRSEILSQEFLYGADLQYSSIDDPDAEVTLQSTANGHEPARFQIVGNQLQLISDTSLRFESDSNRPGRLITQFPIVSENTSSVTIRIEKASPNLVTVLSDAEAPAPRSSWIRSVEYVQEGNYLLFESSIESAKGELAEFMETIFPRSTLVNGHETPLLADAAHEPLAERFRFLSGSAVWLDLPRKGRTKTSVAMRYKISGSKPISWYVTPNVPLKYLPQIRAGIEGWNRYSQKMWGRDLLKFEGLLPQGIKLGDPRYNIVSWDSVKEAGSAFQTGAADPRTGIISHSLIYLPSSWLNTGRDYWKDGFFTEPNGPSAKDTRAAFNKKSFLGNRLRANCITDPEMYVPITSLTDPETFARELLRNVLFHEIGHSLGLAHNFKGSVSNDPSDDTPNLGSSIMDYNQYHIERSAFDSTNSSTGPLLEYDRQILSAIYNNSSDIINSPVLPACDDDDADNTSDGIDPLCIRYDAGRDPSAQLAASISLVTDKRASLQSRLSLASALDAISAAFGDAEKIGDLESLKKKMDSILSSARGTLAFYIGSGAQSVRYMAMANVRNLYIYKKDSLPKEYNEDEMRLRALSGIQFITGLEKLPESVSKSLNALFKSFRAWAERTPAARNLPADSRADKLKELLKPLGNLKAEVEASKDGALLVTSRKRVLAELLRIPTAPFYLWSDASETWDIEKEVLKILERSITSKVRTKFTRPESERLAAAVSLLTFKDTQEGRIVIERASNKLKNELRTSSDARARESVRNLIKKLEEE